MKQKFFFRITKENIDQYSNVLNHIFSWVGDRNIEVISYERTRAYDLDIMLIEFSFHTWYQKLPYYREFNMSIYEVYPNSNKKKLDLYLSQCYTKRSLVSDFKGNYRESRIIELRFFYHEQNEMVIIKKEQLKDADGQIIKINGQPIEILVFSYYYSVLHKISLPGMMRSESSKYAMSKRDKFTGKVVVLKEDGEVIKDVY